MSEIVERAARALTRLDCEPLVMSEIAIGLYVDKRWHEREAEVRAILEALREPSEAMIDAGSGIWTTNADWDDLESKGALMPEGASEVWQAMINAALAENSHA